MKSKFWLTLVTGLLVLSLLLVPGLLPQPVSAQASPGESVPGEVIVGFPATMAGAQAQSALDQALPKINGKVKKASDQVLGQITTEAGTTTPRLPSKPLPQAFLIELKDSSPQGVAKALTELKKVSGVRFAEPNYIASIPEPIPGKEKEPQGGVQGNTNDPLLVQQWGYFNIGADLTAEFPRTAPTIAIIDTGVDYNHPDLKGRVIKGPDFVNGDNDPMDDNGHGTACAGIAGAIANNNIGITGTSPTSKIYAVKVCNAQGWGTYYDIGLGITAAASRSDVKVLSLSVTGHNPSEWLESCVNSAWGLGKIICAAAGNSNTSDPVYPAYYENCIAVAANGYWDGTNFWDDGRAIWNEPYASNYGVWVDISAPGTDIVSTVPSFVFGLEYLWWSGTSMSTPQVAAAAARVWTQNPSWTNSQVRNQLENTVDKKPLDESGEPNWPPEQCPFGRLNLFKALGGTTGGKGLLAARVLDGTTGNPVVGATMQVTVGRTVVGTDTVTAAGFTYLLLDEGTYSVTFSKSGYSRVTLTGINITAGGTTHLGIIPLVRTAKWTLVITWPDARDDRYSSLYVPEYKGLGPYLVCAFGDGNQGWGSATSYPYARYNRHGAFPPGADGIPLESICIIRDLGVTYKFEGWNDKGDGFAGAKAWIYQGRSLKAIIDAPAGAAGYWYVGYIDRGRWYTVDTVGSGAGGLGEGQPQGPSRLPSGQPPQDVGRTQ
jgi:thermitase